VDGDGPVVTISAPSVCQTDHGPVVFTITYADPRLDEITLAAADVTLVATGTASGTIVVSAGPTAETRLVTIQDVFGNGTLGIALAAGTATDTVDNVAGAPASSETVQVQGAPQVSVKWIKPPKKATKKGAVLTIRITNVGNQLAPDAVLKVTLPKHAVFKRPGSTAGWTGSRTLTFAVGNLGFGATQNIKLAFKLKASAPLGGKSLFKATLSHGLGAAPLAKATITNA
jgi:hypothetical protein